ncbi:MAG: single-stranded DNA-binding protein, partial [Balneolales bacterium]|nr:single-stranded DNA-binding protein [Balneolales bacterium]
LIYIEGPLQTRQWEDNQGQKRYTTEIKALQMTMLDSKGSGGSGGGAPAPQAQPQSSTPMSSNVQLDRNFDDMDDDLPF